MIPIALHMEQPPAAVAAAALRRPAIVSPAPREASYGHVEGRVFAGTTRVRVFVAGVLRASRPVVGPARFSFSLSLPSRPVTIRVIAQSASGERAGRAVSRVYGLPKAGQPLSMRPSVEDVPLARRVRRLARAFPGTAAAYVQDLRTGRGAAWNARARFPAASTLKLPIALEVLSRLRGRPAPGSSLDRQLWRMLVYSDNAAANSLLVWIGGSTSGGAYRVNALMRSLRVNDSLMYGGYQTVATSAARPIPVRVNEQPAIGIGKYTTAWDLARLHRYLHMAARGLGPLRGAPGRFGRTDARYLLWVLANVVDRNKIDRFLPARTAVLHKAGWLRQARHDAGVVYWRGGAFVVTVMTWNSGGVSSRSDELAGRIAKAALGRFQTLRRAQADSDGASRMRA